MSANLSVSVLVFQEESVWIAQCLEYDIAAHGDSLTAVREAFAKVFAGQIAVDVHHGDEPLAGFSPAPKEYWDKFKLAERLAEPQPIFLPDVPPAFMIRAMAGDLRISA